MATVFMRSYVIVIRRLCIIYAGPPGPFGRPGPVGSTGAYGAAGKTGPTGVQVQSISRRVARSAGCPGKLQVSKYVVPSVH